MPKYVSGKDLKRKATPRLLSSKGSWYDKNRLIQTVITKIHGEYRRNHLTEALKKLTRDEILMLEMVFRKGAEKEVEAHLPNCKDITNE